MKRKDLINTVFISVVVGIVAWFIAKRAIQANISENKIEIIPVSEKAFFESDFEKLDPRFFNEDTFTTEIPTIFDLD